MKIIGKVSQGRFLAEVSLEELKTARAAFGAATSELSIGDELTITDGAEMISAMRTHCNTMRSSLGQMKTMAESMDRFAAAIK